MDGSYRAVHQVNSLIAVGDSSGVSNDEYSNERWMKDRWNI
ncbi:MAG: hypothetical protein ACLU4N_25680 [Butyricimonas faecihominis]